MFVASAAVLESYIPVCYAEELCVPDASQEKEYVPIVPTAESIRLPRHENILRI